MTSPLQSGAPRRSFLKHASAGAVGAAAMAAPMVSNAQTVSLRFQSTWPAKDIFHEYANDFAKKVNDMAGGRLKIEVLPSGAVADGPLVARAHVDLHRTTQIHPVLPAAGVQESAFAARATGEGDLAAGRWIVRLPAAVRVLPFPRAIDDRIGRDLATDGPTAARAHVALHHVVEVDDVSGADSPDFHLLLVPRVSVGVFEPPHRAIMVQRRLHAGRTPKHAAVAFRLAADGRRCLVVVAAESVEVDRRVEARWQVDGWVAPSERILDGGGLGGRVGRPRARVALEGAPDGWRLSWSAGSAAAGLITAPSGARLP
jgi:hypothetical protein